MRKISLVRPVLKTIYMQGRPEKNLNLIASPEDLQSKDKLPD
jgi:hypothetical protein